MEISKLKEDAVHGTAEFPMAVYQWEETYRFPVPLHWHDEAEMICLEKGKFHMSVNMKEMTVDAPALVFIEPQEIHSVLLEEKQKESALVFHRHMLSFEYYDLTQYQIIRPLLEGRIRFPRVIDPRQEAWDEISHIYRNMYSQILRKDLGSKLRIKAGLYQMLACLYEQGMLENVPVREVSDSDRINVMKRVLSFIHEAYGRKLSVDEIAGVAGMNPQYFCRYFKKITGKTVTEYVNDIRINHAAEALSQTEDKITDIAFRCGYDNVGYFIRRFQKTKNMTPSAYRQFGQKKSK